MWHPQPKLFDKRLIKPNQAQRKNGLSQENTSLNVVQPNQTLKNNKSAKTRKSQVRAVEKGFLSGNSFKAHIDSVVTGNVKLSDVTCACVFVLNYPANVCRCRTLDRSGRGQLLTE